MNRPRIFLVEDNPADFELLAIAFEDAKRAVDITCVRDGRQARKCLQSIGESDVVLIVLDINVPIVSGLELLEFIRGEPATCRIPTVVLTSSDRPQDRERAQQLGVDAYLIKPRDFSGYERIVEALGRLLDHGGKVAH
jgi:CheY-like chemotaxis protein